MGIEAGKLRQEKPGRRPGLTCYLNITKKPYHPRVASIAAHKMTSSQSLSAAPGMHDHVAHLGEHTGQLHGVQL